MKPIRRFAAIAAAAVTVAVAFATTLPIAADASTLDFNTCNLLDKAKELQSLLDRYREQGFSRPDWKRK